MTLIGNSGWSYASIGPKVCYSSSGIKNFTKISFLFQDLIRRVDS